MTRHQQLVTAAAGGDDQALARLMSAYHERVYRFGLRACHDGFDADDAVQEAFSKLARRPDVQRDTGALFWLLAVVKRACQRLLRPWARERAHWGERLTEGEDAASVEADPEAALERFELVRAVHAGIARLPRPYREVLILRDLEGLSGAETCAALGLELGAMKTRLHVARAQLREQLSQLAIGRPAASVPSLLG